MAETTRDDGLAEGRRGETETPSASSPDCTDGHLAAIRGARVLIIDDERLQCAHLARSVQTWGAVPSEALTFRDALRLHRETSPDIVLLDVMMPHVDGYKLAQMFKRDARFVPIILLTALEDLDSKRRGLAAGADEFLTKPVNLLELQIRVSSMLRIKRLADELSAANERLSALARTDPLTQLVNRRALSERLAHELARSRRYGKPLACLMVDVDHFKRVNDVHGHPVGDRVLARVGGAIAATIRKTDLVGRYGGEEFMVLAPETPLDRAKCLGERLRAHVASLEQGLPAVTVSIGVATTELPIHSADDLVARTDGALYRAKGEGRNRVVGASGEK